MIVGTFQKEKGVSELNEPAQIALVGAGRIGRLHMRAIQASPELELAGVVEPSEDARAAIAAPDLVLVPEIEQLFERGRPDAIVVAVPTVHHKEVVSRLIEVGVPILCEKPGGLDSGDVHAIAQQADEAGVALQVGYWRRFVPALRALRSRILEGGMGEVSMLSAIQWDGEPPHAAFRDVASSGGIAIDMGVHEFDMLRWLTGQEIEEITGYCSTVNWAPPVEGDPETANFVARMSGGATAIVSLARRHPPGDVCRLEVLGGDDSDALTFIEPGESDEMMIAALRAQAEGLAAVARGTESAGASIGDAEAALIAAEEAMRVIVPSAPTVEVGR